MKRIIAAIIVALMLITCMACGTKNSNSTLKAGVQYPRKIAADDYEAQRKNELENQTEEAFRKAIKDFCYKTTASILSEGEDNISYSPVSLYFALAVLSEGAEGDTLAELSDYLELKDVPGHYRKEQTGKLYRTLYSNNEASVLKIANSVWAKKGFLFKKNFLETAAKDYYASLFEVDFFDSKTPKIMQEWVSEQTEGLLKPEINLSDEQVMTIMNTIYFNARFQNEFDKNLTAQDIFYKEDGSEENCDFMHQTFSQSSYLKGEDYVGIRLYFKDRSSILLVLPNEGTNIKELVSNQARVTELCSSEDYTQAEVILSVPKLDLSSSINLAEHMKKFGVEQAFEPEKANFSKMSDESLFVSMVKQDVRLKMDEEGVEAAAYTEVAMCGTSMPEKLETVEIDINRPFGYFVQSKDGLVLFAGVCKEPGLMGK